MSRSATNEFPHHSLHFLPFAAKTRHASFTLNNYHIVLLPSCFRLIIFTTPLVVFTLPDSSHRDNICRRYGINIKHNAPLDIIQQTPQSMSRNSIRFLIVPLRSVASLSTFCALLISAAETRVICAGSSSFSKSSSPIKTTFSPRITYKPSGISQKRSPTITRSHAPSITALANWSKERRIPINFRPSRSNTRSFLSR